MKMKNAWKKCWSVIKRTGRCLQTQENNHPRSPRESQRTHLRGEQNDRKYHPANQRKSSRKGANPTGPTNIRGRKTTVTVQRRRRGRTPEEKNREIEKPGKETKGKRETLPNLHVGRDRSTATGANFQQRRSRATG